MSPTPSRDRARPKSRTAAHIAFAVSVLLTLGIVVLFAFLELDPSHEIVDSPASIVTDLLMALSFAAVGALITLKRPDNRVGWALSLSAIGLLAGGLLDIYGELALLARPEAGLPGGTAAEAVTSGAWTPLIAGVFLLLVLFPEGNLPSPRWRVLVRAVLAGFAIVWFVIATTPGRLDPPYEAYENPLSFTSRDSYIVIIWPIIAACLVSLAVAGIGLILRFRRSQGLEREQYKWLAASVGFLILLLPLNYISGFSGVVGLLFSIALIALPVSVGIAVLRYRLYEIDRLINRTLVYGAVTAMLAGLYFAIVLGLQAAFSGFTRGNDLAIAGSTLAVAALFRPARARIQAFVDRRFYRRRYDAEQTLAAFSARLRDEVDLDRLGHDLGAVVHETMQPAHVSLWIRGPGAPR